MITTASAQPAYPAGLTHGLFAQMGIIDERIQHEFILKTGLSGEKREAWASPEASV